MSAISYLDLPHFERWARKKYPKVVEAWEYDASEWCELDGWIDLNAPEIIREWRKMTQQERLTQ